jgi:hypothetical protein
MRVLQFAFAEGSRNPYLPHHHEPDSVVYTGTHDNDTTLGWWSTATDHERAHVKAYLGTDGREVHWDLIRAALASVADTAIVPLQDVLVPVASTAPAGRRRRPLGVALRLASRSPGMRNGWRNSCACGRDGTADAVVAT